MPVSERGLEPDGVAGNPLGTCTDQDKSVGGLVVVGWNRTWGDHRTSFLNIIKSCDVEK